MKKDYEDIPGTFVFDADRGREGYQLNQFCISLRLQRNRDEFNADEEAYLDRYSMKPEQRQAVLDRLQDLLATTSNARIVVLPVEAVLPRIDDAEVPANGKTPNSKKSSASTREELYDQIEKGARLDGNFLILVVLSTVVAAIGLL